MPQPKRRASRGDGFVYGLLPALILLGLFFWCVDSMMRPAIESMSQHQARVYAARCVNEAMALEMSRADISYDTLVFVTQNNEGEVSSIQTNIAEVGRVQTRFTETILGTIEARRYSEVQIPLGTMLGNQLLSGRGPLVTIRIVPVGALETRLQNEFTGAGINQTLHRIMLEAVMEIQTLLPGYTLTTEVKTSYCIAETVIVGKVPEGYTSINGDEASIISKINDYRAETP